jgi:hypothetical protein
VKPSVVILLVAFAAPVGAVDSASQTASDELVEAHGGGKSILSMTSSWAILDQPSLRAKVKRAGIVNACPILFSVNKQLVDTHYASFRPHVLVVVRKIVPADRLLNPYAMGLQGSAMLPYASRVRDELDKTAQDIPAKIRVEAPRLFKNQISTAPRARESNPSFLGKVDFSKPAQILIACGTYMGTPKSQGGYAPDPAGKP